jgi:hypothetical protein
LIKPELSAAKYFVTLKNNDEQIWKSFFGNRYLKFEKCAYCAVVNRSEICKCLVRCLRHHLPGSYVKLRLCHLNR